MASGWGDAPSTVTVYPSGSRLEPVVLADTVRLPVVAEHVTVNAAVAVPPEGTETVCDVPPDTVQFAATPESTAVWLPVVKPVNVRLPLIPIAWGAPPSTETP